MLNTYHSSHRSHPISPIERWKIYFDVIYRDVKDISTVPAWIISSFSERWVLISEWKDGNAMSYDTFNTELNAHCLGFDDYPERQKIQAWAAAVHSSSVKLSAHVMLWNSLIWVEPVLMSCAGIYTVYMTRELITSQPRRLENTR